MEDIIGPPYPEFGIYCDDLSNLGQWILDTKPLLRAGLVWYLPSFAVSDKGTVDDIRGSKILGEGHESVDYIIRDGRAIDASGASPFKKQARSADSSDRSPVP
ncbi:hypothetical protein GCM10023196_041080 [Actinoallomurus vinaceus]|uniref:Uncharacterized protein n=1 Tax=Actinoallomurus vinaceus TaxID=1080074 RepID=A0ABP8UCA2_9ACTN